MKKMKSKKLLAIALTATMVAQPLGAQSVFAFENAISAQQVVSQSTTMLHDGTAIIPSNATLEQVREILGKALLTNPDQQDLENLEWEYECEGKSSTGLLKNTAWGSIGGFTSQTGNWVKTDYTHPSLAKNSDGDYKVRLKGSTEEVTLTKAEKLTSAINLKDVATANLVYNDDGSVNYEAVRQNIFNAVVDSTTPDLTLDDVTIEYYATATSGSLGSLGHAWAPIDGATINALTYPGIPVGEQKIKVSYAGSDTYYSASAETTVNIGVGKEESTIEVNEDVTLPLVYNDDNNVDYDALRQNIFNTVVKSTTPELTVNDVTIEYYATATTGSLGDLGHAWAPIEGAKVNGLTYPAMGVGSQKIKISYAGNNATLPTSVETTVNFTIGKEESKIIFKENPSVLLVYNDDLTVDYDAVEKAIMKQVVDTENSSPKGLTLDDVTIEYYATATTGSLGDLGHAWAPIEGAKISGLTYPGLPEGEQEIRVTYAGNKENTSVQASTTITVVGRKQSQFNVKDLAEGATSYEVPMAFNDDQTYDYDATAKAIYQAVIDSTDPETLTYDDITVEYNAGTDVIKNWQSLDSSNWTNTFTKFGPGEWTIRFSWGGNKEYKGTTQEVKVKTTDNRIASNVVCKEGASFTYNMDANVMKQAIFDNVIDWENSTLPAKDTLTVDDFTFEYYGSNTLAGDIDGGVKQWAPIEGGTVTLLTYTQMGAGEQQIRVTYKGNAGYRPSATTESTVTVNKAKVSVKVKSTNIYADETLPEDFITMDPADKFDVYTIYGGLTSNANLSIYMNLPEKYTNSTVLKLLDPIIEKLYGKTFTQMINDGLTVGELRELFSTQELLDLLEKLHIDTGTFGQILTVINKLPSVADSVRISFGTPNRAGLYSVTAVTDNKNYETGVGVGALLVKMRSKGVKLNWNQKFVDGKITAEEAKSFDFKATISVNGDVTVAQDNIHYLYSGFTSKWKLYSSTTTPPTEPGSYVMTVVTLGGNYQAAPITRGFKITK